MNDLKALYQTYEKGIAENIIVILEEHAIGYKINAANNNLEPILGSVSSNQYEIYVEKALYTKALSLIGEIAEQGDTEINLTAYSDQDIRDILLNQNDWHDSFINAAQDIAQERNITIDYQKPIITSEQKLDIGNDIETASKEANKEARITLLFIAGICVVVPIILFVSEDEIKVLSLLFYILGASIYSILGLFAKRMPLTTSILGLLLLLTVYYFIYLGDPSMVTRYIFLKTSLVFGLGYAIIKEIQSRMSRPITKNN